MKKIAALLVLVVAASLVMGCYTRPPVVVDMRTENLGTVEQATNAVGSKTGEASSMQVLGLYGAGDDSIAAAAKAGGISKIGTVSRISMQIGWLYGEYKTVVTGE
jgi:hypothetical protein